VQQQYAPQPQQYAPQPQQYAPQPQQYAPQPVAPQNVVVNMMQAPPQAPIIINNNNNNNNNSMQMQGPTPQRMYTQGPRTGWHSGLFECANDIPVCCCVFWFYPCAYGMIVDMNMDNKAEPSMPCGNFGACFTVCAVEICFGPCIVPCITSGNRTSIRNKLNLRAEPCDDLIVHCCCLPCALCQECRELKDRHGGGTGDDRFRRY